MPEQELLTCTFNDCLMPCMYTFIITMCIILIIMFILWIKLIAYAKSRNKEDTNK